jgi:hypothetical protein
MRIVISIFSIESFECPCTELQSQNENARPFSPQSNRYYGCRGICKPLRKRLKQRIFKLF